MSENEWNVLVRVGQGERQFAGADKTAADALVAQGLLKRGTMIPSAYLCTDAGWKELNW